MAQESWHNKLSDEDLVRYGKTREDLRYMDEWITRLYRQIAQMELARIVGYLRVKAAECGSNRVEPQVVRDAVSRTLLTIAADIESGNWSKSGQNPGEIDPESTIQIDNRQ